MKKKEMKKMIKNQQKEIEDLKYRVLVLESQYFDPNRIWKNPTETYPFKPIEIWYTSG